MPTVLIVSGWRFFFYANERNEPMHVHCQKGNAEAKYWLDADGYDISEAHNYGMTPADRRAVRKIIFDHFGYLVEQWNAFQERKNG